ncbi:hypothetical protein Ddye_030566 [Dipteronia dyeriana]|uniref:Uncharacterized protein n=1 Tax=Dipteronia dyeriana TaxID=168575 RepID=A0AAD9WLL1_9ROSI|nr:hypothetical protein Ddye_030566 [Dipteronia dyeriana]
MEGNDYPSPPELPSSIPSIKSSISLTYCPNFNIPLRDQNLHNCLKVQLQVVGAPMMPNSYMVTLHNQIAYRLQDRALDLPIPGHTGDTIFIKAEREDGVPTIIQIPKQIPRDKLTKIMPLKWITNYTKFTKLSDGSIHTTYELITAPTSEAPASVPSAPTVFQVLMIRPVISEEEIPIHSFEADGSPIYTDKINNHFIWDIDPKMCDADYERKACSKVMRSSCKPGLLPNEPKEPEKLLPPLPAPMPYFMVSSYDEDFPHLEPSSNPERNLFSRPFIQTIKILLDGSLKQPSQAEQVLNWHSRNARVQNRVLHSIDQKIDQVSHHVSQHDLHLQHLDTSLRNMYTDLQSRVARLDVDLYQYINQGYFGPDFDNKERELPQLKDQLDQISQDHFTNTPYVPRPHPYATSLYPILDISNPISTTYY